MKAHLRIPGNLTRSMTVLLLLCLFSQPDTMGAPPEGEATYQKVVKPFVSQHCVKCHGPKRASAGFRVDQLGTDFLAGKNADAWKEVIDRINLGQMPPKKEPRPDPKQAFAVVEWVGHGLKRAEREARMAGGRILIRRLNRSEYANTVRDLLHLDQNFMNQIEEDLPGDGKAEGFDRIGSALLFDETQLSTYLRLGKRISEKAILTSEAPPATARSRMELEDVWRPVKPTTELIQYQKDTAIPTGPDSTRKRDGGVEFLEPIRNGRNGAFGHLGARFGRLLKDNTVPQDGYYRLRIRAGAFQGELGEPVRMQWTYGRGTPMFAQGHVVIKGTLEKPEIVESVIYLRKMPTGARTNIRFAWNGFSKVIIQNPELTKVSLARRRATGQLRQLASAKAPKAELDKAKAELAKHEAELRAYAKKPGAVARVFNPRLKMDEVPRLFIDWYELEGPIQRQWPPKSHASLFPDGLKDDPKQVREVFSKLLPRAYRRPVTDEQIQQIVNVVRLGREKFKMNHAESMRFGLQTALCTPDFLMIFEPAQPGAAPRKLNDYELASRLSYFLWSSMPDKELFDLAAKGTLNKPDVLKAQVKRMLSSSKSRELVENFAGQWLHVREFGSVMPANNYKDYDVALADAEKEEPYAFFEEILKNDLSILNFLDSEFVVINERLAKFYGIEGVTGPEFRKVPLQANRQRGGVLTMGGLLTYLADGTRTLPVRRGAWILEEIFNDPPPPPPPNAGEIQPNVRGQKLTVRQRLEMHRNEPTCASCHAKIDPLGLALENYDAIGAWRTDQNGEGFRRNAPPIDASGTLPSGRAFKTPNEFKKALLAEKDRFTRAFTEKMLTYALGRPVGYTDRKSIDQIVAIVKKQDYRMQSVIQAIVASELFQTK